MKNLEDYPKTESEEDREKESCTGRYLGQQERERAIIKNQLTLGFYVIIYENNDHPLLVAVAFETDGADKLLCHVILHVREELLGGQPAGGAVAAFVQVSYIFIKKSYQYSFFSTREAPLRTCLSFIHLGVQREQFGIFLIKKETNYFSFMTLFNLNIVS